MHGRASEEISSLPITHYLLTPWCRVLENLTGLQLVKKFPAFYGTRRFITTLTSVRYLPLSWASPIQSTYPHPTSWRSILILSTHLRLGLPQFSSYKQFVYTFVSALNWFCLAIEIILPWFSISIVFISFTLIQVMFLMLT